ncbi:hypothetical protein [uncultured Limimaricola sp.]|uniref:hypothetical protein n=1 Tax=uncultured Limimaricola sp. TaxID=2211667 RepID=UPI0030F5F8F9
MTRIKMITAAGLLATLAACAPGTDGEMNNVFSDVKTLTAASADQSAAQKALASQERDYAKVRVQSAAGGAIGGLLLCQLQGCSNQQTAAAMVAGATAGYAAGGYLSNQNKAFQATQETLTRDIELAQQDNKRLASAVAAAEQVVGFQKSEIARLNAAYGKGEVSAADYKAKLATMQADVKATQSLVGKSQERLTGLDNSVKQHGAAGLPTAGLSAQRNAQLAQLNRLRAAEKSMIGVIGSAPAAVRS